MPLVGINNTYDNSEFIYELAKESDFADFTISLSVDEIEEFKNVVNAHRKWMERIAIEENVKAPVWIGRTAYYNATDFPVVNMITNINVTYPFYQNYFNAPDPLVAIRECNFLLENKPEEAADVIFQWINLLKLERVDPFLDCLNLEETVETLYKVHVVR